MPYADKEKQRESQRKYEEKRKEQNGTRHRVWTGIFYPESAPQEWPDLLSELHLKVWVSPLHDRDTWTQADEKRDEGHKAGTLKKPHHHYTVQYDTPVDQKTVTNDFKFLKGPKGTLQHVRSLVSMVRYLTHMDDEDKAQYSRDDIKLFGGASIDMTGGVDPVNRDKTLKAMRKCIRENNFRYYCDFMDYCDDCEEVWAHLLNDDSTYSIKAYIESRSYKLNKEGFNESNNEWVQRKLIGEIANLRARITDIQERIDDNDLNDLFKGLFD